LFSFYDFFEDKKYFICQVKTNGGRYRDDKKENNLHNQFNVFFHINPIIKIAIIAARNPAIKPC
jgi:hypothetical protein